jgi:speckle-type POZ protein
VTFEVGGEKFMAHRCVLAARSIVFKAELFGPMKEGATDTVVSVKDMEPKVFRLLLGFMYSDSVPNIEEDEEEFMWQHLLVAADKYDLPRLRLICEQNLCKYITSATVSTILESAEKHHCQGLKDACFDFLTSPENQQEVAATGSLDHMISSSPSALKEFISKLVLLKFDT